MKINFEHALLKENIADYQDRVNEIHELLFKRECKGNDFLGWLDWPYDYDKEEFARIKEVGKEIRENADVLLVCGIGGSYLGARSAIEMMKGLYPDDKPEIIYTGNGLSSTYLYQVLNHIKGKSVYSMNISLVRQLLIIIPCAYIFAKIGGVNMVWWAFPVAEVAGVTMSILYTKRIRRTIISKMTPRDADGNVIEA